MDRKKSLRKIAHELGIHEITLYRYVHKRSHASLEKAVAIEIATGGKYKVEDLVRPEVADALKKFLILRCPMLKKSSDLEEKQSVNEEDNLTVEVKR